MFHTDSLNNPADLASCGCDVRTLLPSKWFHGAGNIDLFSRQTTEEFPVDLDDLELKISVYSTRIEKPHLGLKRFERFSSWKSVIRAVSFLIRRLNPNYAPVESDRKATTLLLKEIQSVAFGEVKNHVLRKDSNIVKLSPILDKNELLRVGGRLPLSTLPYEEKHPIILPGKTHMSTLLVQHFHEVGKHQGHQMPLGTLRSCGYWIIGGNRAVSSSIRNCVICRKLKGNFCVQKMAPLPVERCAEACF